MINQQFVRNFDSKQQNQTSFKKVLCLSLNGNETNRDISAEAETGFLNLGLDVCTYTFREDFKVVGAGQVNNNLIELVDEYQPDILYLQLQKTDIITPSTLQIIKSQYPKLPITNWTGDVHFVAGNPIPSMVKMSPYVDLTILCSLGDVRLYKKFGCKNVVYMPTPYEHDKFCPLSERERNELNKKNKFKIIYCGNNYGSYTDSHLRTEMVNKLNNVFRDKFQVFGYNWILNNQEQPHLSFYEQKQLYNSVDIAVSIDNRNDIEGYWSDRRLIAMACKCLVVSKSMPNGNKYFQDNKEIVYFNNFNEMCEKIRYFLSHPEESKKIVDNAYNLVYNIYRWDLVLNKFYIPLVEEIKNR